MKTLKIAFLLLAVVMLTVSGQSSDTVVDVAELENYQQNQTKYDLLAMNKKLKQKPNND
ncbi:hypothetical protein [Psychroserpens sp.]|uniref:hypothetical protein n=1 Tax=Psychroserpens sp. TaxID=2020870 RepID=UPI00385835DE